MTATLLDRIASAVGGPFPRNVRICLALGALGLLAGGTRLVAQTRLDLEPCRPPGVEETVRCGDLLVPENPRQPVGRKIKLHVVVLPALDPAPHAAPLFDLAGGPGIAGTGAAPFYATDGRIHRRHRDVVLIDQRGTGESSPLRCEALELEFPRDSMYPVEMVERCRETLARHADLAQYTTANAAADVDAVRAALGYSTIDLFGLSYGTRLALTYLRLHPEHTRAVALAGTLGDGKKMPLWHARNAQEVLDRLFAQCAADPACHGAFPNLAQEWRSVLARLDKALVATSVDIGGRRVPVVIRRGPFGEAFRNLLLSSDRQSRIPLQIHRMAGGDFRPVLPALAAGSGEFAEGLYLSVTCAEDTPFITAVERQSATANTFLGTYRIDEQAAACKVWNVPPAPAGPSANPDVPILLIAGGMDYVTPSAWARAVAALFPRSRLVGIPDLGHFPAGLSHMDCFDQMLATFYEHGDARAVDTACVKTMTRPPFVVAETKPAP